MRWARLSRMLRTRQPLRLTIQWHLRSRQIERIPSLQRMEEWIQPELAKMMSTLMCAPRRAGACMHCTHTTTWFGAGSQSLRVRNVALAAS